MDSLDVQHQLQQLQKNGLEAIQQELRKLCSKFCDKFRSMLVSEHQLGKKKNKRIKKKWHFSSVWAPISVGHLGISPSVY